jgi:hypothetical protein
VLGWTKICRLGHAFLRQRIDKLLACRGGQVRWCGQWFNARPGAKTLLSRLSTLQQPHGHGLGEAGHMYPRAFARREELSLPPALIASG